LGSIEFENNQLAYTGVTGREGGFGAHQFCVGERAINNIV